jgi:hypothetical protein
MCPAMTSSSAGVDAGHRLEHFHVEMTARSDSIGAVIELTGLRLAERNKLLDVIDRHGRIDDQCVIDADKAADRREILHRIVSEPRVKGWIDDEGRFRTDEQRVAVTWLMGDVFGGDLIVGAGLVFDNRLRAPIREEVPRQYAAQHVRDAGRGRNDDRDRFRRISVGVRGRADRGSGQSRERNGFAQRRHFHFA